MSGPPHAAAVPLHPEPVAGEPDVVRWVLPAGTLPTGRLLRAPGRLGAMLDDETIGEGLVEHTALWLRLCADLSWSVRGGEVRSALQEALVGAPRGWVVVPAADEVVTRVAADVLAGPAGDYVRSHGGLVEVARVEGGVLVLALGGACAGCPALGSTLRTRLETALRRRLPDLAEVRATAPRPAATRRERTPWRR